MKKNKDIDSEIKEEKEILDEVADSEISEENIKDDSIESKEIEDNEMQTKFLEISDKYVRLSAEFDNYRKRTLKERIELSRNAGEELLKKILPVIDNFERALLSLEKSKDMNSIKDGINLIYVGFKDFLKQNGVVEIECINKDFDTDVHEAITEIPAPSKELKGKVVDCVEKGYFLNDKVMRYSKVVVGK